MSELFDEEEKIELVDEGEELPEEETIQLDVRGRSGSNARRRLEDLLEEKRLRDELDDFLD